jgi:hypothetical protein
MPRQRKQAEAQAFDSVRDCASVECHVGEGSASDHKNKKHKSDKKNNASPIPSMSLGTHMDIVDENEDDGNQSVDSTSRIHCQPKALMLALSAEHERMAAAAIADELALTRSMDMQARLQAQVDALEAQLATQKSATSSILSEPVTLLQALNAYTKDVNLVPNSPTRIRVRCQSASAIVAKLDWGSESDDPEGGNYICADILDCLLNSNMITFDKR